MSSNQLSDEQRDMAQARRRIKLRHARPYIDGDESDYDCRGELTEEINRAIREEMPDDEQERLETALSNEMEMIEAFHEDKEFDGELK
jgi:hypothetical protein